MTDIATPPSRSYPDRPIVGVGVVVFKGEDVLLVQRGRAPRLGQWSLPGGAQELGETVVEAAHREVLEETGIEVEILGLVDVVDSIQPDGDARIRYHYTLIDLAAEWRHGDLRAGDDAAVARWVRPSELDGYTLWSETVRIIGMADRIRRESRAATR